MADSQGHAAVTIVGGGFSGTMLAAELARRGIPSTLVEGSGRAGLGTAYSTDEAAHLLNVPAGRMSAWADQPGHFASEIASDGYEPHEFVPRRRYGEYLRKILTEAIASGLVRVVQQDAGAAERGADGWSVRLAAMPGRGAGFQTLDGSTSIRPMTASSTIHTRRWRGVAITAMCRRSRA